MDPLYRPFFSHVWAFCWPWLWWNLVRLHAWRARTGRPVIITVDKLGNISIRIIGDVPKARTLPLWRPRWEHPSLHSSVPLAAADLADRTATQVSGLCPDSLRTISAPHPDQSPTARAPP